MTQQTWHGGFYGFHSEGYSIPFLGLRGVLVCVRYAVRWAASEKEPRACARRKDDCEESPTE